MLVYPITDGDYHLMEADAVARQRADGARQGYTYLNDYDAFWDFVSIHRCTQCHPILPVNGQIFRIADMDMTDEQQTHASIRRLSK